MLLVCWQPCLLFWCGGAGARMQRGQAAPTDRKRKQTRQQACNCSRHHAALRTGSHHGQTCEHTVCPPPCTARLSMTAPGSGTVVASAEPASRAPLAGLHVVMVYCWAPLTAAELAGPLVPAQCHTSGQQTVVSATVHHKPKDFTNIPTQCMYRQSCWSGAPPTGSV